MVFRGQFSDFFLSTMLPALNAVIWKKFNQYPEQYSQIFNVQGSTKGIEQFSEVSGVGLFTALGEGEPVRYDQPVQGFDSTFTHTRFGLGIKFSQDVVEDDKIGLIAKQGRELGRSARETREISGASTFNNGFDTAYAGPDAKPLFSATHPLVKSGGVQSNLLSSAADLDPTSLQLALTDFETQKDSSGKLIHVPCRKVVVAPANRFNANEIIHSAMRSDTANNTTNALKYAQDGLPEPFVWRYLTDPDAWFLVGTPEDTGLVWFDRRKPYTRADFDFDSEVAKNAMRYKKSHGWTDFYGVYGTPGA
jgi:hypothetical protein